MLFYRVKPEADQKPMLIRKRGRNEIWSVYIKGELFTPNEVIHRNLKPEYLEGVEVNRRKTQKIFGVRMPTSEASITPVKLKKEVEPNAEIESIARFIVHSRPDHPNERSGFEYLRGSAADAAGTAVRDTHQRNTPRRVRRHA